MLSICLYKFRCICLQVFFSRCLEDESHFSVSRHSWSVTGQPELVNKERVWDIQKCLIVNLPSSSLLKPPHALPGLSSVMLRHACFRLNHPNEGRINMKAIKGRAHNKSLWLGPRLLVASHLWSHFERKINKSRKNSTIVNLLRYFGFSSQCPLQPMKTMYFWANFEVWEKLLQVKTHVTFFINI